jgi:hypothetical protein
MATVDSRIDTQVAGLPRVIWGGAGEGDDFAPLTLRQQYGLAASVQAVGTFGGATVGLQISNDGANWAAAKDLAGDNVSMTGATDYFELSLSGAYMRPIITGGSGADVDVILVLRGSNAV